MKKVYLILVMACMFGNVQHASAQSFLEKLGSAASSLLGGSKENTSANSTVNTITNIASMLLGTKAVSAESLQGTWVYSQPSVAFESENVLSSIGGVAASSKIENSLAGLLGKVGFTSGKLELTLNADSTGYVTTNTGKKIDFTWSVEETNMTMTFPLTKKTVQMNAKLSAGTLQVALKADKLLTLVSTISEKASSVNSTAATINSLVKGVKGLYIGLKFTKKANAQN